MLINLAKLNSLLIFRKFYAFLHFISMPYVSYFISYLQLNILNDLLSHRIHVKNKLINLLFIH